MKVSCIWGSIVIKVVGLKGAAVAALLNSGSGLQRDCNGVVHI